MGGELRIIAVAGLLKLQNLTGWLQKYCKLNRPQGPLGIKGSGKAQENRNLLQSVRLDR